MSNTVYILGAGASIGAKRFPTKYFSQNRKMPSGKNFFSDIFENPGASKNGLDFFNIMDHLYEGLSLLIQQSFKLNHERQFWDKNEWKNINIEDVFTFIDIGTSLYSKNSKYRKVFNLNRENLIDFIFISISMRTLGQHCKYLVKLFRNISNDDNIVTFNWDTIADTTLEYLKAEHYKNYISLFSKDKINYKEYIRKGLLLKLHGSLNWMVCKNKLCEYFRRMQLITSKKDTSLKNLSLGDFKDCPYCGNKMEIYIIPPTSNKIDIYKNNFISKQWLIVREKLKYIEKLVFIGYSFPPTDFYSEWLFRQINFLVDKDNKFQTYDIDVVNPECMNKRSITYQRYKSIFKKHKAKYYKDLESYIK
jgi:hypothetical protein